MSNNRFNVRILLGLLAVSAAAPLSLTAGDVSWAVTVTFSDNGTLSGNFVYDADTGVMRSWNLATSGGDPVNFPNFTYTPANSSFFASGSTLIFQGPLVPAINPFSNGFREMRLGPFSAPLSDAGGARGLPSDPFGNLECYNCGPVRTASGTVTGTPLPDLTITKSHVGNFNVGQTGATYTIQVTNSGLAATQGQVTVVDSPPLAELTPTGIFGIGWACSLGTLTCTNSTSVLPGASFPPITVQVSVNVTAATSVTNTVTVSGGGEANASNDTAMDPTNILHADMVVAGGPGGPVQQGAMGVVYAIGVANTGPGASFGVVTLTVTLPQGLSAAAITGPGWNCVTATVTCSRLDPLPAGLSYPNIFLDVNVASNAPPSMTTMVTVSGGSEINTANDTVTGMVMAFPPLNCVSTTGVPPLLRQEGGAELAGDYIFTCTGGVPAPLGLPVPIVNFVLSTSASLGGKLLNGTVPTSRGEALALIDEPGGLLPTSTPTQLVCADPGMPCLVLATGNGQGDYDGSSGRPNIFQSIVTAPNTLSFMIPFDPPGVGVRIVRFTNLRIDARSGASTPVSATLSVNSELPIPITNPQQIIGNVSSGEAVSFQGGGTVPNRVSQFSVIFQESFASSLRPRSSAAFAGNDVSPAPANQNVPGKTYFAETAFHSPAFPVLPSQGDLTQAGLADSGTRLMVKVLGVPSGVQLMVPGAVRSTTSSNPSIGVLRLVTTDANGAGAFTPNGTAFSLTPMSIDSSGNAYATYEVLSTDPLQLETVTIPVTPVYPANSSTVWLSAQVTAGQAPLDGTSGPNLGSPVPRFSNPTSATVTAFQPPPVVSTTILPGATAGQAYSFSFGASSGLPPYTWSATGLPFFLSMSNLGVLSGNFPSASLPSYAITVTVRDSKGVSASAQVTIAVTIPPPLTIGATSLPPGVPGAPYNFLFTATGGTAPYSWSASGLPAFLNLSASGPLTGTIPANPLASYSFGVSVRDANGGAASVGITLTINRPPLTLNVSQIPSVVVGLHFSTLLTAAGVPPITWTGSGLPSWLTLQTDGLLQGTPPVGANLLSTGAAKTREASTTSYGFTIMATDATGNSGTSTASVTVAPPPLLITTSNTLPGGMEGKAYSTQLAASGGTPPYTWSGAGLSAGLSLSSSGVVSGTPPSGSAGSVAFQAIVQDSDGTTQSASFAIPIASGANQLTITTPGALPVAGASLPYTATLTASGGRPPYTWSETSVGLGLGLSSGGVVSGTAPPPTTIGFTGQVTDSAGATAAKAFTLSVIPKFGITTPSPLAAGIVGVPYFQLFGAIGGTQPYQWSISGALPAGLGFTPDGVISGVPSAQGSFSVNVTVRDSASNVATAAFQISIQPPANVDLILSAGSLAFSAQAEGSAPPPQSFGVNATGANSIQFSSSTDASWIRLSSNAGPTPGSIGVFADSSGLGPGFYQGTITVSAASANSKSVPVSLTVAGAVTTISISPSSLQLFATASSTTPVTSAILILSTGSLVAFQANVVDLPFLSVSPQQGSVAQNNPAVVNLSADTHALAPGFYRGRIEIAAGGSTTIAFVTIQVGAAGKLILSSRGTTLEAQEGTAIAAPATQSFRVLAADATSLPFTTTIVGSASFLTLGATSGVASLTAPVSVPFTVSAAGLSRGVYYGRIRIDSPGAANSPLEFSVVVNVRAPGVTPDLNPFPSGLVFVAGGAAQTIQAFTDSGPALTFQVAATTQDGQGWLAAKASQTTISATSPAQVAVSASSTGLAPGIYRGFIALAPASAQVRTVAVTLIVPGKRSASDPVDAERPAAGTCAASQLVLTQTGLSGNFTTAAAWPRIITAQLTDDCGTAISSGNVVASFSNGDPPLTLASSDPQGGVYSTNWAPSSAASPLAVTLSANASGFAPVSSTVSGGVSPNTVPIVSQGGVLHVLNPKPDGLLAPGTIVEIFGTGLASSPVTTTFPPPTSVNGTSVLINGIAVPLYYVSPTQIDAELPTDLTPGREYQLLVNANGGYTDPRPIQSVAVVPGVAAYADGHVIAQHSDYSLVSSTSPAKPGEPLVIYLAGMGATDIAVATGSPGPSGPLANVSTPLRVLVDGQSATVIFAGLTPQAVGLYQINFTVPAGIRSGDVALEISQGSVSANKTTLTIAATP